MSVTYSNPRVSENIFNLVTLLWICLQQSPDQILGCMREEDTATRGKGYDQQTTRHNSTCITKVGKDWYKSRCLGEVACSQKVHIPLTYSQPVANTYMYMQLTVIIGGGSGREGGEGERGKE